MLKVNDTVKVTSLTDDTADNRFLNQVGVVVYLNTNGETGNTVDDPLYEVHFADFGESHSYWEEELTKINLAD